jgi:hypothetical protein
MSTFLKPLVNGTLHILVGQLSNPGKLADLSLLSNRVPNLENQLDRNPFSQNMAVGISVCNED